MNDTSSLPQHIAVIMDGNGRWAKKQGKMRTQGHARGAKSTRLLIEYCVRQAIPALTVYAFSSENWNRPRTEVKALMDLFMHSLRTQVAELADAGVRIRFIGDLSPLSNALQNAISDAEQRTAHGTRLQFYVAINYGARWDILQAARSLARSDLPIDDWDEAALAQHLCLAGEVPNPDLVIRTGGEQRLSNFLLWQIAYAELWFTDTLWPDLSDEILDQALAHYAQRDRRYGSVSSTSNPVL